MNRVLEDASNELPGLVRLALERTYSHWIELDAQLAWCDEQIEVHVRTDVRTKRAAQLQGIGPITASAIIAGVGEFSQFRTIMTRGTTFDPDHLPQIPLARQRPATAQAT